VAWKQRVAVGSNVRLLLGKRFPVLDICSFAIFVTLLSFSEYSLTIYRIAAVQAIYK
jgi:hypothetical protein